VRDRLIAGEDIVAGVSFGSRSMMALTGMRYDPRRRKIKLGARIAAAPSARPPPQSFLRVARIEPEFDVKIRRIKGQLTLDNFQHQIVWLKRSDGSLEPFEVE